MSGDNVMQFISSKCKEWNHVEEDHFISFLIIMYVHTSSFLMDSTFFSGMDDEQLFFSCEDDE